MPTAILAGKGFKKNFSMFFMLKLLHRTQKFGINSILGILVLIEMFRRFKISADDKSFSFFRSGLAFSVHLINWPQPYLTLFYSLDNCQVAVASFHVEKGKSKMEKIGNMKPLNKSPLLLITD